MKTVSRAARNLTPELVIIATAAAEKWVNGRKLNPAGTHTINGGYAVRGKKWANDKASAVATALRHAVPCASGAPDLRFSKIARIF